MHSSLETPRHAEALYGWHKLIIKAKDAIDHHLITSPTVDPADNNTLVEVYFQMGKDELTNRVLVDLLEHVLDEPFYNELRTKEQFGYEVTCGAKWTFGVLVQNCRRSKCQDR